ncbi:MAG TPA: hypothetical protein VF171_05385 [Trueperaceae bacterium]
MSQRVPSAPGSGLLWFGLLGGAAAWSVNFVVAYALAESTCFTSLREWEVLGVRGTAVIILVVSLVTALVALIAALVSWGNWRRWRGGEPGGAAFASLTGLILSGVFLFIILVESLPVLFVGVCS